MQLQLQLQYLYLKHSIKMQLFSYVFMITFMITMCGHVIVSN